MSNGAPLTYLFVPGSRPERFAKAVDSGADRVILDLEDAVAPEAKAAARSAISEWMQANRKHADKVLIRINDAAKAQPDIASSTPTFRWCAGSLRHRSTNT